MSTSTSSPDLSSRRLLSLDFFRGMTMFLLIAEFTLLFEQMAGPAMEGTWLHAIGMQFHHHPWSGLRFWDLIQPYFMFIVGVAIPYAVATRIKKGETPGQIRKHAFTRAFLLLLLGWGLYCVGAGKIVFLFQNVLAQLAVTYLLAFLVMNQSVRNQVIFSLALILLTEILYRTFWVEGFNHPFVANENFGTWLDLQYGGADLGGSWVSFNAIPTTAHTIWGVLAGQLLRSDREDKEKLKILLIAGVAGLILGYALSPITPIIKRICTSSFIFVSGGWTILTLAFCYWLIDMKKKTKGVLFFAIVGMNSLFIYLFAHLNGAEFIRAIVHPFSDLVFGWTGKVAAEMITSGIVLALLWYLCYWLYKRKLFIKI